MYNFITAPSRDSPIGGNLSPIIPAVIFIGIVLVIVATFIGPQIGSIFEQNQTQWDAPTIAIWAVIGVFVGIAILIIILRVAGINIGSM